MPKPKITVLRLGHRFSRDKRISTHIALVSRAFGANELVFDEEDNEVAESLSRVCKEWGGKIKISFIKNWKTYIEGYKGDIIHLTMYGLNINIKIKEIRESEKDKLIIIGGQKVPSEVYGLATYNLGIGNQPHSEVAALAVFLDRYHEGKELTKDQKGKKRIIPQARGKKVEKTNP
jgi:tRNA (cytidine56-2'-O)-methyltransferase